MLLLHATAFCRLMATSDATSQLSAGGRARFLWRLASITLVAARASTADGRRTSRRRPPLPVKDAVGPDAERVVALEPGRICRPDDAVFTSIEPEATDRRPADGVRVRA